MSKTPQWVEEHHPSGFTNRYEIVRRLFLEKSAHQTVEIVETRSHGRMLLNDGLIMLTERDEFIYHEMIAHVPLFTHAWPRRVLVIGGGDGGTVREVLRHPDVESCVLVEIDEAVVRACREHLPQTAAVLNNDDRVEIVIEDAARFVAASDRVFDVVLVDSTDPIGPARPLFDSSFYADVERLMASDGVLVAQAESPFYHAPVQERLLRVLSDLFPISGLYNFTNATYPGGLWSFAIASKKPHPLKDYSEDRARSSGLEFRWYTPEIHRAAFVLPEFQRFRLSPFLKLGG